VLVRSVHRLAGTVVGVVVVAVPAADRLPVAHRRAPHRRASAWRRPRDEPVHGVDRVLEAVAATLLAAVTARLGR
jgi:hypothetical protein